MAATTCRRGEAEGALPLEPPIGCEAGDSYGGDDLPPRRSRGGATSGASPGGGSRRFSLRLKKKLCINPMQQLLF